MFVEAIVVELDAIELSRDERTLKKEPEMILFHVVAIAAELTLATTHDGLTLLPTRAIVASASSFLLGSSNGHGRRP